MINRRQFLAASGALLAQACASKIPLVGKSEGPGPAPDAPAAGGPVEYGVIPDALKGVPVGGTSVLTPKGAVYMVPTPHIYFKKDQDLLGKVKYDRLIPSPKGYDLNHSSTISVIPDSGQNVKRVRVPSMVHAIGQHKKLNLLYLISVDQPSSLFVLDPQTFEVINWLRRPVEDERYLFSGHVIEIPGTDFIAMGMTGMEKGKHDHIAIRHARTLKVEQRFSTHGFEVHEVVLSPDQKLFACAHYGSFMGTGPYKEIGLGWNYYYVKENTGYTYPAYISLLDAKTGELKGIYRDPLSGQHGHTVFSEKNEVFVPHLPPWVAKQDMNHPRFKEGVQEKPIFKDEFEVKSTGLGVHIAYDLKHHEVLAPARYRQELVVANSETKKVQQIDVKPISSQRFPHSLDFHPDGKHYVVTTQDGVMVFERGTHKFVRSKSFDDIYLATHSHFQVYQS